MRSARAVHLRARREEEVVKAPKTPKGGKGTTANRRLARLFTTAAGSSSLSCMAQRELRPPSAIPAPRSFRTSQGPSLPAASPLAACLQGQARVRAPSPRRCHVEPNLARNARSSLTVVRANRPPAGMVDRQRACVCAGMSAPTPSLAGLRSSTWRTKTVKQRAPAGRAVASSTDKHQGTGHFPCFPWSTTRPPCAHVRSRSRDAVVSVVLASTRLVSLSTLAWVWRGWAWLWYAHGGQRS